MDEIEIPYQESLVSDSFSTIERLENEMATITREFESLDEANQGVARETTEEVEK